MRRAVKGQLVLCSRCNSTLFLKYIGKETANAGYTVYDTYEDLPKNWLYDSAFGYLCPLCASEFEEKMGEFFFDKDRLPPAWKTTEAPECSYIDSRLYMINEVNAE